MASINTDEDSEKLQVEQDAASGHETDVKHTVQSQDIADIALEVPFCSLVSHLVCKASPSMNVIYDVPRAQTDRELKNDSDMTVIPGDGEGLSQENIPVINTVSKSRQSHAKGTAGNRDTGNMNNVERSSEGADYVQMRPRREPIERSSDIDVDEYDEIDESKLDPRCPKPEPPPIPDPGGRKNRPPIPSSMGIMHDMSLRLRRPLPFKDESEPKEIVPTTPPGIHRQVLMTGVPDCLSIEEIAKHIETEILAVGNMLEDLTINRGDKEAIVTLRTIKATEEIIARTAAGEKIKLAEKEVDLLMYHAPPTDLRKALVCGITRGTTADEISRFVESRCGNPPDNVIFGDAPGTAIACLNKERDLVTLKANQSNLCPLGGRSWSISIVGRTRKIRVQSIVPETTTAALTHYFENKEMSRGGPTKSIIYRSSFRDYIVTFKNFEDADHVVEKADHTINDGTLDVSLFYSCLESSDEFLVRKPPPAKLHNIDPYICRFLHRSKRYREDMEENVKGHHGRVLWPDESNSCIRIECDVEEKDRTANDVIKYWEQNAASAVPEICRMLSVHKFYCALEILETLDSNMKAMNLHRTDDDSVYIFFEENAFVIAGEIKEVENLEEILGALVLELEVIREYQGQSITKILMLKRFEVELMRDSLCLEKMNLTEEVTLKEQKITIKGQTKKVDAALLKVKDTLERFPKLEVDGISALKRNLLQLADARVYIEEIIKERTKVVAVLELLNDSQLILHCATEEGLKTAASTLHSCLKSSSIAVENMFQTKKDRCYLADLESRYKGKLRTQYDNGTLVFVSADIVHEEIKENIMKYIDSNTITTEILPVDHSVFRYIFMFKSQDIADIEQGYKTLGTEIDIIDKMSRKGFLITGEKGKCKLLFAHLQATIDPVVRSDHIVSWTMFEEFLRSSDGNEEIRQIELAEKCVLAFTCEGVTPMNPEKRQSVVASCKIGHSEIKVIEGDILELQVDYVGNPTNSALEQKRGLGRTLVDKGGFSVQKDCQQDRSLKDGDVFVGSAGSLHFKGIIHMVLPSWNGGDNNEHTILYDVVTKCLKEADRLKSSSIALPPVGVGQFCYPREKVAHSVVKAVKDYLIHNGTETLLRQVYVCDIEGEMSALFLQSIETGFGTITIHPPEKLQNSQTGSMGQDDIDKNSNRIKKEIIIGSLVSQDADVIVNSTNCNLDLRVGVVSSLLLREGGETIATACYEKYPNGIIYGQVAETTGGKLKCKAIFHGVLLQWSQDKSYAETILQSFMRNCLVTAHKRKYFSIAFPVLGVGALGFPVESVAELMFRTIDEFGTDFPSSILKTVYIVIRPEDKRSVRVFEEYKAPDPKNIVRSKSAYMYGRVSNHVGNVFTESGTSYTTTIDHVTLCIEHGDLTKSTASVIVNSVGEDLNLNTGKIAKAILNAGGGTIQREATENSKIFRDEGLVMTNSGKLLCRKVIHVKAKNSIKGWKTSVGKCLEIVESSGLNSVSFPALGTGGKGFPVEQIARAMFKAIKEYVRGKLYQQVLKSVKFIVFDKAMAEQFIKEIKRYLNHVSRRHLYQEVRKRFDLKRSDENTVPQTVVHIYSESPDNDVNIMKRLEDLQKSVIIRIPGCALATDTESKVKGLKQIGQTYEVEVHISKDSVKLTGYREGNLRTVHGEIQRFFVQ